MSTISDFHCPKCGKLKLKRDGSPHKCGPTDKQRIEQLERDCATLTTEIVRLRQIIVDVHEMAVQSPYFGNVSSVGAAKVIADIAEVTSHPYSAPACPK